MFGKCLQYVCIDFYRKKTEKQGKNDAFHALLVIKGGGKPLITTNKLAIPVGGLGPHTPLPTIETYQRGFPTSPLCTGGRVQLLVVQGSLFWQDPMFWQESYRILKEGLVVALCRPNLTI